MIPDISYSSFSPSMNYAHRFARNGILNVKDIEKVIAHVGKQQGKAKNRLVQGLRSPQIAKKKETIFEKFRAKMFKNCLYIYDHNSRVE